MDDAWARAAQHRYPTGTAPDRDHKTPIMEKIAIAKQIMYQISWKDLVVISCKHLSWQSSKSFQLLKFTSYTVLSLLLNDVLNLQWEPPHPQAPPAAVLWFPSWWSTGPRPPANPDWDADRPGTLPVLWASGVLSKVSFEYAVAIFRCALFPVALVVHFLLKFVIYAFRF